MVGVGVVKVDFVIVLVVNIKSYWWYSWEDVEGAEVDEVNIENE